MVSAENFPNAYREAFEILKRIKKEDFNKIPKNIIEMIQKNMNEKYEFVIDDNIDFEEIPVMTETKTILAYIFLNYLGTEEQKQAIMKKFKKDLEQMEEKKKSIYDVDVFKEKRKEKQAKYEQCGEQLEIVIYKKEPLFVRIWNKIRDLLNKI